MTLTSGLLMASLGLVVGLVFVPSVSTTDSFPKTPKKLNESAALNCDHPCPGVTQWWRNGAVVAQCGPGANPDSMLTCAVNEGSTLTIPQVNYSTRGRYSVYCSGTEIFQCRQFLQLLPPEFALELDTGDLLKMDLQISGTARIFFTRAGNLSQVQLCTIDGRHHGCLPEYEKRVFTVGNTFIVKNTVSSDSGIYTIQEEDGTTVSIWNVTIKDVRQTYKEVFGQEAVIFGVVMLVIGVILGVFGVPWMLRLKDRVLRRLRGRSSSSRDPSGSVENGGVPLKEDLQGNMDPEG